MHSHVRIDAVISKECIDYSGGRMKNFAIIPVAQQCEISHSTDTSSAHTLHNFFQEHA